MWPPWTQSRLCCYKSKFRFFFALKIKVKSHRKRKSVPAALSNRVEISPAISTELYKQFSDGTIRNENTLWRRTIHKVVGRSLPCPDYYLKDLARSMKTICSSERHIFSTIFTFFTEPLVRALRPMFLCSGCVVQCSMTNESLRATSYRYARTDQQQNYQTQLPCKPISSKPETGLGSHFFFDSFSPTHVSNISIIGCHRLQH